MPTIEVRQLIPITEVRGELMGAETTPVTAVAATSVGGECGR
jgi:hypothetical protein